MTVSLSAVKETSTDVAVLVAVLSEVDGVFTIMRNKEWHRRLFSVEEMFCFTRNWLWQEFR